MSSILERPGLNKIFLIYGNLDDMFMSPDLQKNNFRPFLNAYLKSLGYEQIVFYSGAKNVGKYVLDDESAVHAINKNKQIAAAERQGGNGVRKRRILNPQAAGRNGAQERDTADNGNFRTVTDDINKNKEDKTSAGKLVYKQPKLTPAEFLDDAKIMMAQSKIKTAVVFTFFQDFITDASSPQQQYSELLSHLWDEYSLSGNDNICIFLAPQMDSASLLGLFDNLVSGAVFRNRFFNDNGTINRRCTIHIDLPQRDEFRYMLEYLRITGDGGKKLTYSMKQLPELISSLMYLSREANREENRAGYLSSVYENIIWYMKSRRESIVRLDEYAVRSIYGKVRADDVSDPMEKLMKTKGWENVAKRVDEIVRDYKRKKEKAKLRHGKTNEKKRLCSNERIDPPDNDDMIEYSVPHFILKGNPGVGKTTVARLIGQIFYNAGILKTGLTVEATRDDLIDKYVGGTTEKTRACVMRAKEGVLFIDDAYSLLESGEENNYPKQAIDELVAIMTNPKQYRFCLIMAGYPEPMDQLLKMNAGLNSRFSRANILTIDDYPPELLKDIFISQCRSDGYRFSGEKEGEEPLDLDLFFKNLYDGRDRANFGNARDVVSIAREAKLLSSLRDDEDRCIKKEDFGDCEKYFVSHGVSSIDDIYREIDKYVGLEFVKELFENVRLEILDVQDCRRRGVKPDSYPDHYIFAGNPGTGKTTVGKLMGEFYHLMGALGGAETIFTDASELIGSHVGDSKNKITEKIQEAIDRNSLLYIDEAYQIADTAYSSEIVGAMMTKMTENAADFKMIFGMYTNRVEDFLNLNAGLRRRLRTVEFHDYDPRQLTEIFDRTISEQGRTITDDAHRLIELLMEYKYNTRDESFGNAGEVKKLVIDMKQRLLRRVSGMDNAGGERYVYTADDIPPDQLDLIKDQINPRTFDDIMKDLNEQIGLDDLKNIILSKREEILYAKKSGASLYGINPGYYFFVGNPGTGKSTGAKLFGECLRELGIVKTNNFFSCTAKDLIGRYVGETDKKTYELLKKSINGVLFIDEAYSLSYAGEEGSGAGFKKEALEQIIAFMDEEEHRKKCCIIFAGYLKDMQGLYRSNSGMRSRIEEVYFRDYNAEEMYKIFELFCKKGGYETASEIEPYYTEIFDEMTAMEYFSNGRTARTVYEKTVSKLRHRVVHSDITDELLMRKIIMEDTLTREECYEIVNSKQ